MPIPPGGLFISVNFGIFYTEAGVPGPRLYDSPGQGCDPTKPAAPPGQIDPDERCRPATLERERLVLLGTELTQTPAPAIAAGFLPRSLANLRLSGCASSAPGDCRQPMPSLSFNPRIEAGVP